MLHGNLKQQTSREPVPHLALNMRLRSHHESFSGPLHQRQQQPPQI